MSKFKIVLRVVLFIVIGIGIFCVLTNILVPKTMYTAIIEGFYKEPKNSLDVIFIGDSSIYKGISPLEIWKEHGIASYNYASPTQKIWDSYYCIKEVLKYQKPKVIVLNIDQIYSDKPMKEGYKRHLYDNMKLSDIKIEAVTDAVQQNKMKNIISYILPFLRFHNRWNKLVDNDFQYIYGQTYHDKNVFKGYFVAKNIKPYQKQEKKLTSKIEQKPMEYLEKIKRICEENQIELLLLEAPAPKTWNSERHEEVEKWAQKNSISFLDTNTILNEIGINWETDTEDAGVHLNIKGAQKLSKYVGDYLLNHYKFTNHKNDTNYQQWNEALRTYEEYIKNIEILKEDVKKQQDDNLRTDKTKQIMPTHKKTM